MKKTVIFLFLILCMTAVNTGCQKKQETDFILENPKEHTDNEKPVSYTHLTLPTNSLV